MTRHIIGNARTIRTAIMVVEYLRARCCKPFSNIFPDCVSYKIHKPDSGMWIAEIFILRDNFSLEESKQFVDTCRAFVAGSGEVWA